MEEEWKDIANFEGLYQVSNLGRAKSLPRVPILQLDMGDNVIREWSSAREVESTLGFNNSNITNCCRGRYKSMYGYKWKYKQ